MVVPIEGQDITVLPDIAVMVAAATVRLAVFIHRRVVAEAFILDGVSSGLA